MTNLELKSWFVEFLIACKEEEISSLHCLSIIRVLIEYILLCFPDKFFCRFPVKYANKKHLKRVPEGSCSAGMVPTEPPGANAVHYVASSKALGTGLRVPGPQVECFHFPLKVSINI